MPTIMLHYVLVLAFTAVAWPVATLISVGVLFGNPKMVAFVRHALVICAELPPTALFACRGGSVTVTAVDRVRAEEKSLLAWEIRGYLTKVSLLTWNGPPKSSTRVRVRLRIELMLRCLAFIVFIVLPVGAAAWLAFVSRWLWICGAVAVVAAGVFSTSTGRALVLNPLGVFRNVSFLFWGSAVARWIAGQLNFHWLYTWFSYFGGLSADWHDRIVPVVVSWTFFFILAAAVLKWANES